MNQRKTTKFFNTVTILSFIFMLVISNYTNVQAANVSIPIQSINIEKIANNLYCITTIEEIIDIDSNKKLLLLLPTKQNQEVKLLNIKIVAEQHYGM